MTVRLRRLEAAALAASVAACATACGVEISFPPSTSVDDRFARSLAVQMCDSVVDCCLDRGLEEPGEQCHTRMRNAIVIEMIALEHEKRTLQPAYVDACLEAFRAAAETPDCESLPTPGEITMLCPDLYSPIPEGEGAPGSECVGTYDCQSPTTGTRQCALESLNDTTKNCEWIIPVGAGEACAPSPGIVKECPDGLACGPTGTCGAPGENGDVCVSGSCAEGQECTIYTEGEPQCVDSLSPGADCSATPDACREDHFCGIHLTCEPLPNPCADGCDAAFIFENVCLG